MYCSQYFLSSIRGASAPLPPAQRGARLGRAEVTFLGAAAAWARGDGDCVLYFYMLTTFHAKICETFPVWAQNRLIPRIEKWKYVALCNYKNIGSYIKMHPFFTSTLDDNESLSMTKDGKIASHPLDSGVPS